MDLETLLSYPWRIMLPEFVIVITAALLSLLDLFWKEQASRRALAWIALAGIGLAVLFLVTNAGQPVQEILYETFRLDGFASAFKLIFLLGAAIVFLIALDRDAGQQIPYQGEYYYLILTAVLGAMIAASSADLITLFVGIELLSISSYVLVAIRKHNLKANESALKYVISGGIATAVTLFGFSYIYGLTGSTNLFVIQERLSQGVNEGFLPLIALALLVSFVGLTFKLSVVPYHMWAPDVYQGASTPVAAFLSVVSKGAGFALVIRFLMVTLQGMADSEMIHWENLAGLLVTVLSVLAALSMIVGNTLAMRQTNLKRLLAYSSIAQAGYLLVPVAAGIALLQTGEVSASNLFHIVLFYLAAYLFMNLGAFALVQLIGKETEDIRGLAGLYRRAPGKALAMTLFLASLAGIPLTAGFVGKYYILMGAVGANLYALAAVMVITTVISYYYYFGLAVQMYMREPEVDQPLTAPSSLNIVLSVCVIGTLLLGLLPNLALDLIQTQFNLLEVFLPYSR